MIHAPASPETTDELALDIDDPGIRVLLVEPDAAAALRLRGDLASADASVTITHVSGALAALRKLLQTTYDCVLLDIDLPDATGLAACDAFLAHPSQLPVVVLTNEKEPTLALEAVKRGVQDWLVKGETHPDDIARALEFALARRNNELHLRSVRERLLDIESQVFATRSEHHAGLTTTSTPDERLDFAIGELREAIEAASSVINDVRARFAS